jgi:acetyl esterase
VHPELQVVLDMVHAQPVPPAAEQGADALRAAFAGLASMLGPGDASVRVLDLSIDADGRPAIPARAYLPEHDGDGDGESGVDGELATIWYHGGGWVIGSVDTHDAQCRDLAAASGAPVLSVDYRLAPEHRFPAAHDDAEAAARWLLRHGLEGRPVRRLVLGGDSAGGNLAAATARRLRDRPVADGRVVLVALVYPVTDPAGTQDWPSMRENGDGYLLTADTMRFFVDCYLPDAADRADPDASPLGATPLEGLPPTLVLTAEYDPLRDEGRAYAEALGAAGVPVQHEDVQGAVHLAFQLRDTEVGRAMLERVARAVRELS